MCVKQEEIFIPGGGFIYRVLHRMMEGDCQCDHGPLWAEVGPMYADKYPVTNAMYYDFLKQSGYTPKDSANFLRHWPEMRPSEDDMDKPVVWVSYNDACAYAKFYSKELPTDIEWQYFASGVRRLKWPWGNEYDKSRLNADENGGLTAVNAFSAGKNEYGLMDLCGNAWEMTQVYDDGMHRFMLLRGGSYYRAPDFWHAQGGPCANDSHLKCPLLSEGLNRNSNVGFRCIRRSGNE